MPRNIDIEFEKIYGYLPSPQEKWEYMHGTDAYGNLPQYKKDQHVGHCYAPCPYSTQSPALRSFHMLGNDFDLNERYNHTDANGIIYYMETTSKGSKWGFECTFNGCPYLTLPENDETKYFYV